MRSTEQKQTQQVNESKINQYKYMQKHGHRDEFFNDYSQEAWLSITQNLLLVQQKPYFYCKLSLFEWVVGKEALKLLSK